MMWQNAVAMILGEQTGDHARKVFACRLGEQHMQSDSDQPQRHPLRHALLLGLALVVFANGLFAFYWMAHRSYTGIYSSFGSEGTLEVIAIDP